MCLLYVCCEKREKKKDFQHAKTTRNFANTEGEKNGRRNMYDFDARNEILHETHFFPSTPFLSVFLAMFAETETLFHPRFTSEHTARLSRFSTLRAPMIYFPIIYVLPPTRIPGTARVDRSRVGRSAWRIQGVGGAGARALSRKFSS